MIRECLKPRGLAYSQGSVLPRMDVPITILGDVGSNRTRQAVFVQPFVLIVEDVIPVALHLGGQVRVASRGVHKLEGPHVVFTDWSRDVVTYARCLIAIQPSTHRNLEFRQRSAVFRPPVRAAIRPPSTFYFRQV